MKLPQPIRTILALALPARLKTLNSANIYPQVRVSDVDEDAVAAKLGPQASAAQTVCALAQAKARVISGQLSPAELSQPTVVIGCDSMFQVDGKLVGKPRSEQEARQRVRQLSNATGTLWTGHCLVFFDGAGNADNAPRMVTQASSTRVFFGEFSPQEADLYVATGEPLRVAGSFTIDGIGGPFINGVEGDHHAVVGISLPLLRQLLSDLGISITQLWDRSVFADSVS